MLYVRFLVLEKKQTGWLAEKKTTETGIVIPKRKMRRIVNHLAMEQPDDWLKAGIPAIYGPHANHP